MMIGFCDWLMPITLSMAMERLGRKQKENFMVCPCVISVIVHLKEIIVFGGGILLR